MAKFLSRKFILTLVYGAIFVSNYVFKLGIPWEALLALAGIFGIYSVANAYQNASMAPNVVVSKYESFTTTETEDPKDA